MAFRISRWPDGLMVSGASLVMEVVGCRIVDQEYPESTPAQSNVVVIPPAHQETPSGTPYTCDQNGRHSGASPRFSYVGNFTPARSSHTRSDSV